MLYSRCQEQRITELGKDGTSKREDDHYCVLCWGGGRESERETIETAVCILGTVCLLV